MANPNNITIGSLTFASKKAVESHTRALLQATGPMRDTRANCGDVHAFLLALFARHPDADAKLAHHTTFDIVRTNTSSTGAAYGCLVHYQDGRVDDISWKLCVSGKHASQRNKLLDAFRQAVQPQIDEFRAASVDECAHCGAAGVGCHVDHVVEFRELVADFLAGRTDVPRCFADAPMTMHRHEFAENDAHFCSAWSAFHRQHARLQMACADCNLKVLPHQRRQARSVA